MMSARDKKKGALVPRLRFPEFREAEEWEKKEISDLLTIGNGKDYKHLSTGTIPVYGTGGYMLSVNDYLYDGESVCIGRKGTIDNPFFVSGKFWTVDTLFYTHKFNNTTPKFIYFCFQRIKWSDYNAASGVPSLSKSTIERIKIAIPAFKEQKKIADFFSSLDERIAAESDKLDALKDHKKGLLKQLFPAEGETLPALRFPEFQDAGEWKKADFGNIAKFLSGGTPSKDVCDYWGGDIPWISASSMHNTKIEKSDCNITKLSVSNGARIAPKGTLLLLVRGSMLHKRILLGVSEIDVSFNQDVKALVLNDDITELYLMYFLMASESKLLATVVQTGIGAGKLDTDDLNNFPIMMPSPIEQQRISNCLSSLDELITAQTQKIDLLKDHKKGLMQQLFPHIDEVRA